MNTRNEEILNTQNQTAARGQQEEGIQVNGMQQVVEMLRYADPTFRESLIKRISQRDPNLALNLRKLFR